MKHYLEAHGGDDILIDIGDFGVYLHIPKQEAWYDIEYVKIDYKGDDAVTTPILADMVVTRGKDETTVKQADKVRIWRHVAQ